MLMKNIRFIFLYTLRQRASGSLSISASIKAESASSSFRASFSSK
ncbi:hypothetical protein M144_2564 [Bacteroides fragilis str. 3-F-2 |nr:hypothetical protein M144_2564 [Bacteroides fragilis str. 3-F-2 \